MKLHWSLFGKAMSKMLKGGIIPLVLFAFASSAHAQSSSLTPEQERSIQKLIIKTIKERPEIVLEALKSFEAKKLASQHALIQKTLTERSKDIFRNTDDPVGGNPDGDVTLVEFFDYRCGYCKRVHPSVMKLIKEDGNIRYVYKEFPILGPDSVYAARAALASQPQGKYAEFSDALMASRGNLDKGRVLTIARKAGLDTAALEKEMRAMKGDIERILQNNYKLAQELDIDGTPGFVIGDRVIRGAVEFNALKSVVAQTRVRNKESNNQ
jgi:protein-disulfide isomerase